MSMPRDVVRLLLHPLALAAVLLLSLGATRPAEAFHFPWDQGHDTTDWNDPEDPGPCEGPECDPCKSTGSPVYLPTGHLIWSESDLQLPGQPGLKLIRTYNSHDPRDGMFGRGWSSNCGLGLHLATTSTTLISGQPVSYRVAWLRLTNGKRYAFPEQAPGQFIAPTGRRERIVALTQGRLQVTQRDQSVRIFDSSGKLEREASAAGHALAYSYTPTGELARITDAAGRYVQFGYNSRGRVETVTDNAGRVWHYGYDANGNLTSTAHPDGGVRRYTYRSFQPIGEGHVYYQLTKVTDETGVVLTEVSYNGTRVASYTVGENRYNYAYNTATRTVTKTDRLGAQWVFTYDAEGRTTSERNPLLQREQFEFDEQGNLLRTIDALNHSWRSTYDDQGRVTSATDPLGQVATSRYEGENPSPVERVSPAGRRTRVTYDARFLPVGITDALDATRQLSWGSDGNLRGLSDPLGQSTALVTDAAGLPLQVTDSLGQVTRYTYDAAGNVVGVTDPAGKTSTFSFNARQQLTSSSAPSGQQLSYTRDEAGRLETVVDAAGRSTSFEFDAFGRTSAQVLPDGRRTQYRYRVDNLITEVIRPNGTRIAYEYDAAKRLTRVSTSDDTITYTYSARGELLSATNAHGSTTFTYDAAGRRLTETANGVTLRHAYNADGERISRDGAGGETRFEYTARGELARILAPEGNYGYSYDAASRQTGLSYPNGTTAQYDWDTGNQLTRLAYSGRFSESFSYARDARGQLTSEQSGLGAKQYGYDADGRVVSVAGDGSSEQYAFDAAGNLVGDARQYDASNRLLADAEHSYRYDGNGNLIEKITTATGARTVYLWNSLNQLVRVERFPNATATTPVSVRNYVYDALGRRMSRTVDGQLERFVYDGVDRLAVLDGAGQVIERATHGAGVDEPLGLHGTAGSRYLHADRLGSIVGMSDDTGELGRYRYGVYGQTVAAASVRNDFRYTAREYEADDLYYYRARYYDAGMQRFISEDPLGLAGGANLYAYADGDPVNATDPFGEIPLIPIAAMYARCAAQCMAISTAADALLSECGIDWGGNAKDCLLECLNPFNWGGKAGTKKAVNNLHRPYIRKDVRREVDRRAPRTPDGRPIDPNTGKPIDGKPDLGHKPGHEHRRERERAEQEGLSQEEFNDRMNNPDLYQLEDPSSNRSHRYEQKP